MWWYSLLMCIYIMYNILNEEKYNDGKIHHDDPFPIVRQIG
jgi:hypothetical protein